MNSHQRTKNQVRMFYTPPILKTYIKYVTVQGRVNIILDAVALYFCYRTEPVSSQLVLNLTFAPSWV